VRLLLAPIILGVYLLEHPLLLSAALLGLLLTLRRRRPPQLSEYSIS
jgi:hypothetical protein